MNLAILEMPPAPVLDREDDSRLGNDFHEKRRKILERCLEEDKWYLGIKNNGDVGFSKTEEDFLKNYFGGWDDGFLAAYNQEIQKKELHEYHIECLSKGKEDNFFNLQFKSMRNFVERYRINLEEVMRKEVSEAEAFSHFQDRYFQGFASGFRAGYCGLKCRFRENCEKGHKYKPFQ